MPPRDDLKRNGAKKFFYYCITLKTVINNKENMFFWSKIND